jgi:hypothetical protein
MKPKLLFYGHQNPLHKAPASVWEQNLVQLKKYMLVVHNIERDARREHNVREDKHLSAIDSKIAATVRKEMMSDARMRETIKGLVYYSFGRHIPIGSKGFNAIAACPDFNEIIIGCNIPVDTARYTDISYQPMHSYASVLQRVLKIESDPHASVVMGITITTDQQIVFGVRSPGYMGGYIAPVPGGTAKWNSFKTAFQMEMMEELGLGYAGKEKEDFTIAPIMVGGFLQDQRVFVVQVTLLRKTFAEVIERWERAEDKWEHTDIFNVAFRINWRDVITDAETKSYKRCLLAGKAALAVVNGYLQEDVRVMEEILDISKCN